MDGEVTFSGIEETEVELGSGDFQFVRIAGGKHKFAGLSRLRTLVNAAVESS